MWTLRGFSRRGNRGGNRGQTQRPVQVQSLESRLMFCGDHAMTEGAFLPGYTRTHASIPVTHAVFNVPQLNSNAGAKATLYLDFDGDAATAWGSYNVTTTAAYDIDGNAGTFSAQELANINEIFTRVAEKFSPFNINVTTVNPGSFADGKALHVVIGGNGAWTGSAPGGISYVGSFSNSAPNSVYVFTDNLGDGYPKYVAEAVAHESGHAFGLQHQSSFGTDNATKLSEYNSGDANTAPIMGNSYSSARGLWWDGESSTGSTQDDMSVIASQANGFGYRADDIGDSRGTGRITRFNTQGKFIATGLIGDLSDRDFFRISFAGGTLQLKLRGVGAGSMLDAKLRIYRADGTTVVATDSAGLSETVTRTLPAGNYYAMVYSHGSYGDVGQYAVYGYATAAASAPASAPVTHTAPASSGSAFSTQLIGTRAIELVDLG